MSPDIRAATERWFRRRGLPMFIENYSVTEDILTRMFPFMGLVVFAELFLSFGDRWTGWSQLAAFVGGAALVVAGFATVNLLRRRRPLQLPDDVGAAEVALYAVLPVVPSIIGGVDDPLRAALTISAVNLVLLVAAFVVVRWGLVPMSTWAIGQMMSQLTHLAPLALRSLPLVLLFSAFLFLNAEMWQVANDMTPLAFVGVVAMVLGIGGAFVLTAVRRLGVDLASFDDWTQVETLCTGTPLGNGAARCPLPPRPPDACLSRQARWNVTLRLFVAQSTQILLVSMVTVAFYVLFGLLVVRENTVLQWTTAGELTAGDDWLIRLEVLGHGYVFTRQLLVVATFIGLVSGLQFTVQVLTDTSYRHEFADHMTTSVRRAMAVRTRYLAALQP